MSPQLRTILARAGGLAALLLGLAGCGDAAKIYGAGAKSDPAGGTGSKAKADRRFLVRTAKVGVKALRYEIEAKGSVEAQDVYWINAQVAGQAEEVSFTEGDVVTPEKVLCRISRRTYELAAERAAKMWETAKEAWAKANADLADSVRKLATDVERAKVKLAQAERDYALRRPAYDSGAVTKDELLAVEDKRDLALVEFKDTQAAAKTLEQAMRAAAKQKESEAQQAEVAKRQAEEDLRKSYVMAPVPGVIEQRLVTNGASIKTDTAIAQLVDRRNLKLRFTLPEKESAHVKAGETLTFRVAAWPDRDFKATIYRIGELADPKMRLVTCWAHVAEGAELLKPGFFASIHITTEEKGRAVVVPLTAVLPTERGFVGFVVERERALRRTLSLGLQVADQEVEVLSGMQEGETVVTEGANTLQDGVPVREAGAAPPKTAPAANAAQKKD